MFLFRFMHPPLLVPWSEIKVRRNKGWVFEYVIFTMGHELAIPLRIRAKLATKLRNRLATVGPWRRRESVERYNWLSSHRQLMHHC